jgi:hypothetical protein
MARPNAVIDKSLLHAICELPDEEQLDQCFNALLAEFVLIAPSVLIEEVWSDWSHSKRGREPVAKNLVRCVHHLQNAWIASPLDIAFQELVEEKPVLEIPKPPSYVMNSFYTLDPNDPRLHQWQIQTRERRKNSIADRLRQQRERLCTDESLLLDKPGKLLTDIVWPEILRILSIPSEKKRLLEGILGEGFRYRNPHAGPQIDAALGRYTVDTVQHYPVATDCIVTAMVYFYAPLCSVANSGGMPHKLISRSKKGQYNNLGDEKYVQSALLVAGLLTRDEGMSSIMNVFRDADWWSGKTVFVDPQQNIASAIVSALRTQ